MTRRDAYGRPAWASSYATRLTRLVLQRDGAVCHYCGAPATTADHLVARSLGGSDEPANLVACCTHCNYSKGAGTRPATVRRPAPPSREW